MGMLGRLTEGMARAAVSVSDCQHDCLRQPLELVPDAIGDVEQRQALSLDVEDHGLPAQIFGRMAAYYGLSHADDHADDTALFAHVNAHRGGPDGENCEMLLTQLF